MYDLIQISEGYVFRLINLFFVLVVVAIYFFTKRFIASKLKESVSEKGIVIKGKEYSYQKLLNQLLLVICLILLYWALGFRNPNFSLFYLLEYEMISASGTGASGTGFRLSIGQVISVIILFFVTKVIVNLLRIVLFKAFKDKNWIDEARRYTIIQMSRYVIYTMAIIIALKILFGDISHFVFGASALFVGLGLGLQAFFTDVVSGFILLNDGSVNVGDIVELNGNICKVEKISIRTSHVKTTEGKMIIVPNSKFTAEYLTNWSISEKVTRFHVDVTVAYGTDTLLVKRLLHDAASRHPSVEKSENIVVMFDDFGENGLKFQLYFWAKKTWDILIIKSDLRFSIDQAFRNNHIRIPYPQRDMHIVNKPDSSSNIGFDQR